MKNLLLFALMAFSMTGIAQASEKPVGPTPFSSHFGKYSISTCRYLLSEKLQAPDSWCTGYSHIEIAKDKRGTVRITFLSSDGGSVGFPIEVFDRSDSGPEVKEVGIYQEVDSTGCNTWKHTTSTKVAFDLHVHEVEYFSFCMNNQTRKMTLSRNQFRFENGIRQYWINHGFELTSVIAQ